MHLVEVDLSLYFAIPFQLLFEYTEVKHLQHQYNSDWLKIKIHDKMNTNKLKKIEYMERERKILHLQNTNFREDPY